MILNKKYFFGQVIGISSLTNDGLGTATAVLYTALPDWMVTGFTVRISGSDISNYNKFAAITVINSTTITYSITGTPATSGGTPVCFFGDPNEIELSKKIMTNFDDVTTMFNNLGSENLDADAITSAHFFTACVTEDKWDDKAITLDDSTTPDTSPITDSTITNAEIADDAVALQNVISAIPVGAVIFYTGDGQKNRFLTLPEFKGYDCQFALSHCFGTDQSPYIWFNGFSAGLNPIDMSFNNKSFYGVSSGSIVISDKSDINGNGVSYAIWVVACIKLTAGTTLGTDQLVLVNN